jgi:hypothetical protein
MKSSSRCRSIFLCKCELRKEKKIRRKKTIMFSLRVSLNAAALLFLAEFPRVKWKRKLNNVFPSRFIYYDSQLLRLYWVVVYLIHCSVLKNFTVVHWSTAQHSFLVIYRQNFCCSYKFIYIYMYIFASGFLIIVSQSSRHADHVVW